VNVWRWEERPETAGQMGELGEEIIDRESRKEMEKKLKTTCPQGSMGRERGATHALKKAEA